MISLSGFNSVFQRSEEKTESDSRAYFVSLTGLRGLAAFLVLLSHLPNHGYEKLIEFGGIGAASVAVFFTLSGFLMSYLYLMKEFSFRSGADFLIARFSRIYPAYIVVVVFSFVIGMSLDDYPLKMTNFDFFRHVFLSGSVGVFWSIPPEIQFYVVFALMWCCFSKLTGSALKGFLGVLVLIWVLSVMYSEQMSGLLVFSKISYFFAGVFAGWLRRKMHVQYVSIFHFALFVLAVAVIFFGDSRYTNTMFWQDNWHAIWAGIAVYLFSFDSVVSRLLFANWLLARLGLWSFSLYLLHMPVIYFVSHFFSSSYFYMLLVVVLSLFVSYLSYRFVEVPGGTFLKKKSKQLFFGY